MKCTFPTKQVPVVQRNSQNCSHLITYYLLLCYRYLIYFRYTRAHNNIPYNNQISIPISSSSLRNAAKSDSPYENLDHTYTQHAYNSYFVVKRGHQQNPFPPRRTITKGRSRYSNWAQMAQKYLVNYYLCMLTSQRICWSGMLTYRTVFLVSLKCAKNYDLHKMYDKQKR